MVDRIICWLALQPEEHRLGCRVEHIDIDIVCQYSKAQVLKPARSENCGLGCVVELQVLEETGVCSCGQEIDPENRIVRDHEL